MRAQGFLQRIHWGVDAQKRYAEATWFEGLRLDTSRSTRCDGLCFVDLKTRYGKGDNSRYLMGCDLILTEARPDWIEDGIFFEQYKSKCPHSLSGFRFCAHFPHRKIANLWLMLAIR